MRCLTAVACVALLGCATANTTPASTTPMETVRVASVNGAASMTVETHPGEGTHRTTLSFPLDRVWPALRAAYDSVAVPVSIVDPATHTVGNGQFRPRRRLGDVALSKFINCGNTQGGPSADSYEVQMSVVSMVAATTPGTTTVTTTVTAQARPITLSSEYVRCTSIGSLEKRIADVVTAQLSR